MLGLSPILVRVGNPQLPGTGRLQTDISWVAISAAVDVLRFAIAVAIAIWSRINETDLWIIRIRFAVASASMIMFSVGLIYFVTSVFTDP